MPRIAAFRRLRQEDGELQARLGCIVRPRLRNNQNLQANHQLLVCPHLRERAEDLECGVSNSEPPMSVSLNVMVMSV